MVSQKTLLSLAALMVGVDAFPNIFRRASFSTANVHLYAYASTGQIGGQLVYSADGTYLL
jgi:hypothetical protein